MAFGKMWIFLLSSKIICFSGVKRFNDIGIKKLVISTFTAVLLKIVKHTKSLI